MIFCNKIKITVRNSKWTMSITNSVIFKREVNSQSLSPKSPTITQQTIDLNIPNISTKSDDMEDTALNYISDNNSTSELTVRLKRKSSNSLSDSEENILTKKAKLSHENDNDNTSIIDSIELSHDNTSVIELDTSAPREITNTQLSEVASNTTDSLAETSIQIGTFMNNLTSYQIAQQNHQNEAFRLIDDIETALTLFDDYSGGLTAQVKEVEQSIYANNQNIFNNDYINELEVNEELPLLGDNNSENTPSDTWDNNSEQNNVNDTFEPKIYDEDEQNDWDNNSELNNLENDPNNLNNNFEPNILDNNFRPDIVDDNFRADIFDSLEDDLDRTSDGSSIFNEIIEDIGMEPLDNGSSINEVVYSDQIRADDIVFNNYHIHMSGVDNIDYRMVYYDILESLKNLEQLKVEHQALEASEKALLPLVNGVLDIQHEVVKEQISSILETFSHLL
nr:hypothetical protein [Penicillium nordicum]